MKKIGKIIKEIKYGYDGVIFKGEVVSILKEYEDYLLIETSNHIKLNVCKWKVNY